MSEELAKRVTDLEVRVSSLERRQDAAEVDIAEMKKMVRESREWQLRAEKVLEDIRYAQIDSAKFQAESARVQAGVASHLLKISESISALKAGHG
jgi:hypothetical protein